MRFKEISIPDELRDDPFRFKASNTDWNSCIGKQGDARSYIFGFLKSAVTLSADVIENKKYGDRDSVVWPALYSVRHGIELGLKHIHDAMSGLKIVNPILVKNHSLMDYMNPLIETNLGDSELNYLLSKLEIFVSSISNLDNEGQELRYFTKQNGERSLADESIINIIVIRYCAEIILDIFDRIFYRIIEFGSERRLGVFTERLSRTDLEYISKLLPDRNFWSENEFTDKKREICQLYNIGSRQFGFALNVILENRYLRQNIGVLTDLEVLSDDKVKWIVKRGIEYKKAYCKASGPLRIRSTSDVFNSPEFVLTESFAAEVNEELTLEEMADLKTVVMVSRDDDFPENYPLRYNENKNLFLSYQKEEGYTHETRFLSRHTLVQDLILGAGLVGRSDLSDELEEYLTE